MATLQTQIPAAPDREVEPCGRRGSLITRPKLPPGATGGGSKGEQRKGDEEHWSRLALGGALGAKWLRVWHAAARAGSLDTLVLVHGWAAMVQIMAGWLQVFAASS